MKEDVSITLDKKILLTLTEAAVLTGIGIGKLRELSNEEDCQFVMYVGAKRMFKRIKLQEFLDEAYSI